MLVIIKSPLQCIGLLVHMEVLSATMAIDRFSARLAKVIICEGLQHLTIMIR